MKEELIALVKEHLANEGHDRESYWKMYEMAEKEGCYRIAGIFKDIAHEEKTHKHMLEYILQKLVD